MLMDMSLREFAALLASNEPAPGGGSAAALAGLLASSLGLMVARITISKKAYQTMDALDKTELESGQETLERLYPRLEALVDEDTAAFNGYMAAIRMPKETEIDRQERDKAMTAAQSAIVNTPLECCEACLTVLAALSPIVKLGSKNAVSDAAVAAGLAYCGLEGAAMNVRINLPGADETIRAELSAQVMEMVDKGVKLRGDILDEASKRMSNR